MARNGTSFLDLNYLDILASGDTPIHRVDPRAKVLTTALFIVFTISSSKYEVSSLMPFFFFPVVMISLGKVPVRYILMKILYLSPFILLVGIFNPFLDTEPMIRYGHLSLSGGWVSFFSMIIRFVLTVGSALILIATTGFSQICAALERMGMPKAFAIQLLFLYRYIFVLGDEALRLSRARELRSFDGRGKDIRTFGSMAGNLLLRTWDRAQRIHRAMLCRGFRGEFHFRGPCRFGIADLIFVASWTSFFLLCSTVDIPGHLGRIFSGVFS